MRVPRWLSQLLHARAPSPPWMLAMGLRLEALNAALTLAGFQRYGGVLSGNVGPGGLRLSLFLGMFYLASHFLCVLAAPPLLIGSAVAWAATGRRRLPEGPPPGV